VRITGIGSTWNSGGELYLGFYSSTNTLAITEGAGVATPSAWLGVSEGANSNVVSISGPARSGATPPI